MNKKTLQLVTFSLFGVLLTGTMLKAQQDYTLTETFNGQISNRKWNEIILNDAIGKGSCKTTKPKLVLSLTGMETKFHYRHRQNREISVSVQATKSPVGLSLHTAHFEEYVLFIDSDKFSVQKNERGNFTKVASGKCPDYNSKGSNTLGVKLKTGDNFYFFVNSKEVHKISINKTADCNWDLGYFYNPDGKEIEIKEIRIKFIPASYYTYTREHRVEDLKDNYPYVSDEFHKRILVRNNEGKYGYLNEEGKEVIPFIYSHASDFAEMGHLITLAVVKKGNKYGLIDHQGVVKLDFSYDSLYFSKFNRGLYGLSEAEQINFINKDSERGYINKYLTVTKVNSSSEIPVVAEREVTREERNKAVNDLLARQGKETKKETTEVKPKVEKRVKSIGNFEVFKIPDGGYGYKNWKLNKEIFPPIFDYINMIGENAVLREGESQRIEITYGDYSMKGYMHGEDSLCNFSGDITCNACWGKGVRRQKFMLKGNTTKTEHTRYLGGGTYEKISVYTKEPDSVSEYDKTCQRCQGLGKLKGIMNYRSNRLSIIYDLDGSN